jgi:MoaA/NifB/PqqE/SkfB family radical SAM enzyme
MPWLDWIQVEVTSRCNASCSYCPRTVYRSKWENRDLPFEIFERLAPVFRTARMVHLQGWGEPLLHRQFFEMIAFAKHAGCMVSTTTNGVLLDHQMIGRLIEGGIDHVAFSLAGIGGKNDAIRKGTDFGKILQTISNLNSAKKAHRVEIPAVNVAYTLLRSHLRDVCEIVPALRGRGIEQVIISSLDFVPSKDLQEETILPADGKEYEELKSVLDRVVTEGKREGLSIYYRLASPGKRNQVCTENIRRAFFISADGSVSPCVLKNIPSPGVCYMRRERELEYHRLSFGTVVNESISTIWRNNRYTDFKKSFDSTVYPPCENCPKLYEV